MENPEILVFYLISWAIAVVAIHRLGRRQRLPFGALLASHLVPSIVAILMTWIFIIRRGATVAQLAGTGEALDLWSVWFKLWPLLFVVCIASTLLCLIWTVAAIAKKQKPWIPVAATETGLSAFAFFTVMLNFPDA